jgi:hypothetical protein
MSRQESPYKQSPAPSSDASHPVARRISTLGLPAPSRLLHISHRLTGRPGLAFRLPFSLEAPFCQALARQWKIVGALGLLVAFTVLVLLPRNTQLPTEAAATESSLGLREKKYSPSPVFTPNPPRAAQLAAAWLDQDAGDRSSILIAVREALSRQPEIARELSEQLLASDLDDVHGHHLALVAALAQAGAIDAALALAQHTPPAQRVEGFAAVFRLAAAQNPETARDLATLLHDARPRPVFTAVLQGWATAEPSQVAEYALTLPHNESRALALATALDPWLLRDPTSAATWITRLENPAERDKALCAWVTKTDSLHRPTSTALRCAATIQDDALRLQATAHALREWATRDPAAANEFAVSTPTLSPEQRPALLAAINPTPLEREL